LLWFRILTGVTRAAWATRSAGGGGRARLREIAELNRQTIITRAKDARGK